MPKYSYTAKSLAGESKSGVAEAKNEHELARILHQEGYILISSDIGGKKRRKISFDVSIPFLNKVSLKEKVIFTRNLQIMISAGISLPRALNTLSEQTKSKRFKKVLLKTSEKIIQGKSFSEAIDGYPDIFSELFVNMVRVGEESGTLESVLGVLVRQMERQNELSSKIKGAMAYPLVIIAAMIGIGVIMLIFVIPQLAETFEDLNIELPLTTRIVIFIGTNLARFWYLLPVVVLLLMFLTRAALKTASGKLLFDSLVLKAPLISPIIRKTYSAYTVRTLGSLISSGVPIIRSLEITSGTLTNTYYKRAIGGASEQVKKGAKLSQFLQNYQDIYPSVVVHMIAVGEETGRMADMLQKLADFFEEEVAQATKNLSSVIEPILMIIIGGVVGFFVISMVQPMYGMIQTL
jgi:type IV pilus assembly protein PilC